MKFLSDILYVKIPTQQFTGSYCEYEVVMKSPNFTGSNFDSSYNWTEETEVIYRGKIYGTGKEEKIYLNDIIATYVYNNNYITTEDKSGFSVINPRSGVLFNISVNLTGYGSYDLEVEDNSYIMNMYRDPKTYISEVEDLDTTNSNITNLLSVRTPVYPRIPHLPYTTNKFFAAGLFAATNGWIQNSINEYGQELVFVGSSDEDNPIPSKLSIQKEITGPIIACSLTGSAYKTATKFSNSVYLMSEDANQPYVKLADVDRCPSEYYLIWIDRTGAYQCQPFDGKVILSEDINTSYTINLINQKHVSNKLTTNSWTLNSGWLNYDQYKAMETIFTSKYLYLFNTLYNEGYEVILNDKTWTEKTKSNKDRLFNLQINVSENTSQNIIY